LAFCLIDVTSVTSKVWYCHIEKRNAVALIEIIRNHVLPGITIHTDEWAAYRTLSRLGYEHNAVCHKYNFVSPENGIHTQNVESLNNILKLIIKKRKGIREVEREDFYPSLLESITISVVCLKQFLI
jgi:hypothetical protein